MVINDVASQKCPCLLGNDGAEMSFWGITPGFFHVFPAGTLYHFWGESLAVKENKVYLPLSLQGFISALYFFIGGGGDGAIGGRYFI